MKRISVVLAMLGVCANLSAMEKKITVSSRVIYRSLCGIKCNNFARATNIHNKLGYKALYPETFALTVIMEIEKYLEQINRETKASQFKKQKDLQFEDQSDIAIKQKRELIIRAILRDHPLAITALSKESFLKEPIIQTKNQPLIVNKRKRKVVTKKLPILINKTKEERQNIFWQVFIDNK